LINITIVKVVRETTSHKR